jgi:hypothetical protein
VHSSVPMLFPSARNVRSLSLMPVVAARAKDTLNTSICNKWAAERQSKVAELSRLMGK